MRQIYATRYRTHVGQPNPCSGFRAGEELGPKPSDRRGKERTQWSRTIGKARLGNTRPRKKPKDLNNIKIRTQEQDRRGGCTGSQTDRKKKGESGSERVEGELTAVINVGGGG